MGNKRISYSEKPLGKFRVVPDFLPPADQLTYREELATILARGEEDIAAGHGIDLETVMAEARAVLEKPIRKKFSYRITWSDQDEEYIGLCDQFPSLSWLAPSPEAALRGIRKVVAETNAEFPPGIAGQHPAPSQRPEKQTTLNGRDYC